ncbi:TPA: hypothetical protein RG712_003836, partial [Proteus mirabilis]|nr:hypothetical protein [Proteus mirabilis]
QSGPVTDCNTPGSAPHWSPSRRWHSGYPAPGAWPAGLSLLSPLRVVAGFRKNAPAGHHTGLC